MSQPRQSFGLICFYLFIIALQTNIFAQSTGQIRGVVTDPSGAVVPQAKVELLQNNQVKIAATTDADGEYRIAVPNTGRYRLHILAPAFLPATTGWIDITDASKLRLDIKLDLRSASQQVTVIATGTPTPEAQLGYAVTMLTPREYQHTRDVQESLPLIPGLQVIQTGQAGGTTSLYIRGGNDDDNKVLMDGIPVDDIGGAVEFGNIASVGIDKITVLRGPNSSLYGSDAMSGVVSMTTDRGVTPLPQFSYAIDGGNFGTYHQEGKLGGTYRKIDYFSDFSRFDTANSVPHSQFHNGTYAGNFGWEPVSNTQARLTVRHIATSVGNANAIQLYGIPDAAVQKAQDTLLGATVENQTTAKWNNLIRYGALRLDGQYTDFAPTGIPYYTPDQNGNPTLTSYLGAPVTIRGANGYAVSGQATFQYPGTYPNQFLNSTSRDFVYAQSDYRFNAHTVALGAFEYEDERGYDISTGATKEATERNNYSYTMEIQGDLFNRLYYTVGSGIEEYSIFGLETTPRASLAYYIARPNYSRLFDGTKLRFSFGKGVKEPSIYYQFNSLYQVLSEDPNGAQLIQQYGVQPIGAERSRSYDGGIDQLLFSGRGRLGITYFHDEFTNGIEFVPQQALINDLGISPDLAQQFLFGAAVNTQAFRSQGFEVETEYQLGDHFFARGGYTYLDQVVQRSFSSDALAPTYNPSFPSVPIGVFSPLVGSRPFRRAPHSGYFGLSYSRKKWTGLLTGALVGKRDDSDFLFDKNGGSTLLLPNRNLDAAYQRLDATASYQVNHIFNLYSSFQNLLCEHYSEAFGYPSLPFTFRSGIQITLGGQSWKIN